MGAQLNIKSEDAYRLASRLAELTGESLTSVVTKALRAELEREERDRSPDAEVERMLAMGREIRQHMRQPVTSDHACLYDENGFPQVIIDASALLAVVLAEPDAARYAHAIANAKARRMPSATWFEAAMRIDFAGDELAAERFDDFVHEFRIEIIPVTAEHAREARSARRRYGKPRHPAGLNFGDCLVYGVAKATGEPLLFKGNDFSQTDIKPALPA